MIAAMLLPTAPAAPRLTAEQALAAHHAATSIGPDPCRPGAGTDDEIVVCARRVSPYALPLYEAPLSDESLLTGRGREAAVGVARDTAAPCHARGEPCTGGLPVLRVGPGGVQVGAVPERR